MCFERADNDAKRAPFVGTISDVNCSGFQKKLSWLAPTGFLLV